MKPALSIFILFWAFPILQALVAWVISLVTGCGLVSSIFEPLSCKIGGKEWGLALYFSFAPAVFTLLLSPLALIAVLLRLWLGRRTRHTASK
ncbi:hypothetical protein CEW89_19745 [Celeribacter ethanolicus]|uniref:Uncharacterized protein n=1 Tax=Celeribacter ethanolicus TaxID=1758178 RepID=A0A291GHD2_9RHOB|nr:hypothetical protein [Celeribacter ethanolicus]ATG49605.1 hypothetical protein CEW89_19745 [Celeribacter ethanolicus]